MKKKKKNRKNKEKGEREIKKYTDREKKTLKYEGKELEKEK